MTEKTKLIKPAWNETLKFLAGRLEEEKATELVGLVSEEYFKTKEQYDSRDYNPDLDDLYLAAECVGEIKGGSDLNKREMVIAELISLKAAGRVHYQQRYRQIIEALRAVGGLRIVKNLKNDILSGHPYAPSTIHTLAKLSIKDVLDIGRPEVFKLYPDDTCHFVWAGEINDYKNQDGIDIFIDFLGSNHPENYQVIKALGRMGSTKAITSLNQFLESGLNTPRRENFATDAREALAKICGSKTLIKEGKETGIENKKLSDKPLSVLLTLLESNNLDHYYAIQRIGDLGEEATEAVPILIEKLETATNYKEDYTIALGKIGDERAIVHLIKFLKSKCKDNHYGAIALGEFIKQTGKKPKKLFEELRDFVKSSDFDYYSKSYVVQVILNYEKGTDVLTEVITKNPELVEWLGRYIETPLKKLNEKQREKILPILEERMLLWSHSSHNIAQQLGQLGNKNSASALISYLSKGLNELFHLANTCSIGSGIISSIQALAEIGDIKVIPQLNQFLIEEDLIMSDALKDGIYTCIHTIHQKNKPKPF